MARKRYEEALTLRTQAGEKQAAAESRVSLAKLAIEEGHVLDAERSARSSQQQFHADQQADDELSARIVLIGALLAQNKQAEAQKEMEAAQQLQGKSQNRHLRLQFELASGHVFLASDHPDAARPLFQRVAGDSHRYGFVDLQFADDLALAEFANKTKQGSQAQMKFRALQKSASSKGFGLIAHEASEKAVVAGSTPPWPPTL